MARSLTAEIERSYSGGGAVRARFELPADGPTISVLFGPSGAGKTTLLRCLAGLERPDCGRIALGEEIWFDSGTGLFRTPQQRRVGLVSQEAALFPHLSVEGNVGYGLTRLPAAERRRRTREMLARVGLERLADRRPLSLSGGERQRTALARALVTEPSLLLLDEPLSALDLPARQELRRELRRILNGSGLPAVLVTHDRTEALALGDHAVVLAGGVARQEGRIEEVFSRPAGPELARILGVETVIPARVLASEGGLVTISVGPDHSAGRPARLVALDPGGLEGEVFACIRAEDVTLERDARSGSSARNRLPARITGVLAEGATARIELDCGFPLVALVTRRSVEELRLAEGESVFAAVKAPSVRLVPQERSGRG